MYLCSAYLGFLALQHPWVQAWAEGLASLLQALEKAAVPHPLSARGQHIGPLEHWT